MFKKTKGLKAGIHHQVFAYQTAGVCQTLWEPVGLGHQQQARRLASVCAHHHRLGALEDFAPAGIEVGRAGDPAIGSGLDLTRVRIRTDFAASGALSIGNYSPERARFRPYLTAEAFAES